MKWTSAFQNFFQSRDFEKALYLTIAAGLIGATIDLSHNEKEIRSHLLALRASLSLNDADKRSDRALVSSKGNRLLFPYYCGIDSEQVLTFKFNPSGKVEVWAQHLNDNSFTFPPQHKPQFIENYHIKDNFLYWSVGLFGNPFNYKAALASQIPQGNKQLILKSGDSYFSPINCRNLGNIL